MLQQLKRTGSSRRKATGLVRPHTAGNLDSGHQHLRLGEGTAGLSPDCDHFEGARVGGASRKDVIAKPSWTTASTSAAASASASGGRARAQTLQDTNMSSLPPDGMGTHLPSPPIPSSARLASAQASASMVSSPSLIMDVDKWITPEDADGAYVRKTYAHFDKEGVPGDGLVDGKEWTREKSAQPAWVVALEDAERRRRRASMPMLSTPGTPVSPRRAPKRNGHLSPATVTPRPSASSLPQRHQPLVADGASGLLAPPAGFSVSGTDKEDGGTQRHASTSSLGSQSDASVLQDHGLDTTIAASEIDVAVEAQRNALLSKIDRYGFFPREDDGVHRGRPQIVILSHQSLKSIPQRRLRRRLGTPVPQAPGAAKRRSTFDKARTSEGIPGDESQNGVPDLPDVALLQEVSKGRQASEHLAREREALRVAKWDRMLEVCRSASTNSLYYAFLPSLVKSGKLRRRIFKGVPDRWRAAVWSAMLLQQDEGKQYDITSYELQYRELQQRASSHDVQIDLDVPRTISGHVLFHTRYGQGQRSLFHVLHAFSLLCSDCAYCQGMGPIVATLLVYYSPERAYGFMVELHNSIGHGLHQTFSPGFPGLLENFYAQRKLCALLCPEVLAALEGKDIVASAYATKWYITLFTNVLPFSTQLRLWDVYFFGGSDALVVAAVAILWSLRALLVRSSFEGCMHLLTREFLPVDDDALLNWIYLVVERDDIRKCLAHARAEYAALVQAGTPPIL